MRYYSLMVKEDGKWSQHFGDYSREIVQSEKEDYLDHDYLPDELELVVTSDAQDAIEAFVDWMNTEDAKPMPEEEDAQSIGEDTD